MVATTNPHAELLAQFKLLPEDKQRRFTAGVTSNPDMRANPAQIAAGIQNLINQHVAEQGANPFAAMLTQANVVIPETLKNLNAPGTATSMAAKLTVPGQQRGQSDGCQIT